MKWSITQLRKYQGKPFEFNQTVNFEHLRESLDLIDLSDINVEGQLTVKSNEVIADMHVTGTYTMPCARTLVPVDVPLDVSTSEVFDLEGYDGYTDSDAEELVIIEKPMRAYSEHSDQMLTEGNGWEVIDEDQLTEVQKEQDSDSEQRKVDPRLQKLQQLYDKDQ